MRKYKRIASIFVAATLTASLFAGCQKSPEKEIVSNKDMDNMIEQAQDTQSSTTEVAEVAKDYDTYQTDIKDDSLHVTVHADAQVDIPDTGQLSIFRVKQMQFDQTFLNQVRTTFFGDQMLYDGTCMQQQTKASIEAEIQTYKDMITDIQNNNQYSDDGKQGYIDEYQSHIDELQEKYETTPESVDYHSYPSDNQIHSIADLSAKDPSNGYYTWQNSFDGANASIYYAMNDGKNGSYQTIYLQNNENYGNLIRYRSSKLGYIDVGSSVIGEESYSDSIPEEYKFATQEALWLWPADASIPIENIQMENEDITEKDFCENPKDKTTISEIDARKTADELLEKLDIHDFAYYNGGLVSEATSYSHFAGTAEAATVAAFLPAPEKGTFAYTLVNAVDSKSVLYMIVYFLMIIAFSYFYATIQFNPVEISNNLKKNGGFIPGFRPGKPTADFIKKVLNKVTLFGAIYLGVVAILPLLIGKIVNVSSLSIGGTSVIIVVGVALETVQALESQMLMRQYKGFLE